MVKRNIRKEVENRSFKEILKYLKKTISYLLEISKCKFILTIVLEAINTILPIVILLLFQNIINSIIDKVVPYKVIVWFCIVLIFEQLIKYLNDINNNNFKIEVRKFSEKKLYSKLSDLRIEDFQDKHIHDTASRSNFAINNFITIFDSFKSIIFDAISLIIYIVIIVLWKPMFLPIILLLPVINIVCILKILKENFIKMWETTEDFRKVNYYNYISSSNAFLSEIKILNISDIFKFKHANVVDVVQGKLREIENSNTTQSIKMGFIETIYKIFFIIYLVFRVVKFNLKIGTFNTYFSAFCNITVYSNKVTNNLLNININLLEVKEFFSFLEYKNSYMDGYINLKYINDIEFRNVYFKYRSSNKYALNNVSFKIKKGDKVGIIGENGSGKTTVLKLLTKVHLPDRGNIYINGIDINYITIKSLRDNIATLIQDYNIFEDSIEFNITLDNKKRSKYLLYNKIPFKNLKIRISNLPNGFRTVLGNWFGKGINFSKGESQKIAISRVFFYSKDVYILDEPNSALDPKSEVDLFSYIFNNIKDDICISILHNLNYLDKMDKILMFENGVLVASGIHRNMYYRNIKYTRFYDLQNNV